MSVISIPRRAHPRVRTRSAAPVARHQSSARRGLWRGRPVAVRAGVILGAALAVVMLANSYVAERQVELHSMQNQVLAEQAQLGSELGKITTMATPARVAAQAGRLHLVEPTSVTQVTPVPLTVRLPLVRLRGYYTVTSRTYR